MKAFSSFRQSRRFFLLTHIKKAGHEKFLMARFFTSVSCAFAYSLFFSIQFQHTEVRARKIKRFNVPASA